MNHRLARSLGARGRLAAACPYRVTRFTCVAESYPDFLADLKGLVK